MLVWLDDVASTNQRHHPRQTQSFLHRITDFLTSSMSAFSIDTITHVEKKAKCYENRLPRKRLTAYDSNQLQNYAIS